MAVRPPSDAAVTLRSLNRRFRGLFTGLGDDESPEALAVRPGADGRSATDHLVAATDAVVVAGHELDGALGARGTGPAPVGTTLGDHLDDLARIAGTLAERVEHTSADEWAASGALPSLWAAIDTALSHLKQAERTLAEVRGRP